MDWCISIRPQEKPLENIYKKTFVASLLSLLLSKNFRGPGRIWVSIIFITHTTYVAQIFFLAWRTIHQYISSMNFNKDLDPELRTNWTSYSPGTSGLHLQYCTHELMHSCTHALMYSSTHVFMYSCTYAFVLMYSSTQALKYSSTHITQWYSWCSCTHVLMYSCTHVLTIILVVSKFPIGTATKRSIT